MLGIIYLVGCVFSWLLAFFSNKIAYYTVRAIRGELFKKLCRLPLKFYDNTPSGDMISRFVNDVDAVADGLLQGVSTLLSGIITLVGAVAFMLYLSPVMALVVLLSAPLSYLWRGLSPPIPKVLFSTQAENTGRTEWVLQRSMSCGLQVVRAFRERGDGTEPF